MAPIKQLKKTKEIISNLTVSFGGQNVGAFTQKYTHFLWLLNAYLFGMEM